jgi:hypothetical protein
MNLSIDPYFGVGPIKLGMSAEEVRTALGLPFKTFKKTPTALMPTDVFHGVGIYVYYKTPGVCEAVEMANPADPVLHGMSFMAKPLSEVSAWLESRDAKIVINDSGLTSLKYGIGLYAPHAAKQPDDPVEAVIVFERGYYD